MSQTPFTTSPIRAVLFDKDGTLLDFDRSWSKINETAALTASKGDRALADRLLEIGGQDPVSGKTRAGSLFAAGNAHELAAAWIAAGIRAEPEALTQELDRIFENGMEEAVPLPGFHATLAELCAAGLKLGIASSDSEAGIKAFVKGQNAEGHFRFLCGYDSGHGPKPEAGMLLAFARHLGIAPTEIAMVGDNTHDLDMAKAAGAGLAIGVLSGTGTRQDLAPLADVILDSLADLPAFFGR